MSQSSPTSPIQHTSVLLHESVAALNPQPGRAYVDATVGGGGHSLALCAQLDESNDLICIDQDPVALAQAQARLENSPIPKHFAHGNFGDLHQLTIGLGFPRIDGGVLMDLGMSAFQVADPERGFSFRADAALDMRMNPENPVTAAQLVNTLSASQLAEILWKYADERLSRHIASAIVNERPFDSTLTLAKLIERIYHAKGIHNSHIHPATRSFQALRIAVNNEMDVLQNALDTLPTMLLPGARIAIITFHSLEDRMVKQAFRLASAECLCPPRQPLCTCGVVPSLKIIGKAVKPSAEEIKANPQSRSAKLRIAERI